MNYFKEKWYSFTSAGYGYTASSERHISLCANGAYKASFESGYSATGQDWGVTGAYTSAVINMPTKERLIADNDVMKQKIPWVPFIPWFLFEVNQIFIQFTFC
jgi:hypothetical protein